jgi:acetylornithine deacetylase
MPSAPSTDGAARDILARLVAFDTRSSASNLDLVDYVRGYLRAHGVEPVLVPNEDGDKASLFATIGPADRGGIALSGHTDVVPADPKDWTSDPFVLTARDGRLYGRGSCDMKGFLAAVLAAVPAFRAEPLATPIHLVFSYDEEIGCAGVLPTIARMGIDLPKPELCIVGEPTSMQVVDAHKGIAGFVTTVRGKNAHSSLPQLGANAIIAAAEIIGELSRIADALREAGDPSGRFEPPFTTLGVGLIQGGQAANVVPRDCRFFWEFRPLPGFSLPQAMARLEAFAETVVLPKLRAAAPEEAAVVFEPRSQVPALHPEPGSIAETLAKKLARQNSTFAVSYGTEAGQFQRAGIPTVVCGPGSIEQAHAPDEFLAESQLAEAEAFLGRLLEHCRG